MEARRRLRSAGAVGVQQQQALDGSDVSVHVWDLSAGRAPGATEMYECLYQQGEIRDQLPIGENGALVSSIELPRDEEPELFRQLANAFTRTSSDRPLDGRWKDLQKLLLPGAAEMG